METAGDVLRPPGPWEHRQISANGARFHVAIAGSGPLVLLLHGFPTFWWTWREVVPALADAGYTAAAMDLRGFGGSDHPPRGYDPYTTSLDVAGVIRSLGVPKATIVGHGWGGFLAWTVGSLRPAVARAIVPVSMAHPRRLREAILSDRAQRGASRYVLGFQRPWVPERALVADDAALIGRYLRDWSADPSWPPPEVSLRFRRAFEVGNTAHCALEYHRWALRSIPRSDGRRFIREVSQSPVKVPVLQIHGSQDRTVLPRTAIGSNQFTDGAYAWRLLNGVGHFPQEEAPARFQSLLLDWLKDDCSWNDPPGTDMLAPV